MRTEKLSILLLPTVAMAALLQAQGRLPQRVTLDDRLAAIEDRLDSVENRISALEEKGQVEKRAERLIPESEAKLDRLEVRVIQLENQSRDTASAGVQERVLVNRIRALERQVARLRAASVR